MINNSETKNVVFTDEQTIQLELFQGRLLTIETQISVETKNLKIIRADSVEAMKEKVYWDGLAVESKERAKEEENIATELKKQNDLLTIEIESKKGESVKISTTYETKEKELSEREFQITLNEQEHEKKSKELENDSKLMQKDKEDVDKAKQALLQATQLITW